MWKVISLSYGTCETRKIRIRGIRGECQHGQNRGNGDVVKPSPPHHSRDQLGQYALVADAGWIGGSYAIGLAEQCDTRKVRFAFFCVGSRKATTPFETASTPVIAVQPLAKTLSNSQRVNKDAVAGSFGGITIGVGCPSDARTRTAPTTSTRSRVPRKR
jgi:hypothetical protein